VGAIGAPERREAVSGPLPIVAHCKRWLSLAAYGAVTSTLFRAHTPPQVMRARFERFARTNRDAMRRKHPQLVFDDHWLGRLQLESVRAVAAPRCVLIHLHGGAFVFGSPASYRNRALRLSFRFGAEVFVPDYRLAPEHAFPAALDDALVAYQYVRALRPHLPLLISGDSAGGGLALSLLLRLRELGAPMPAGAILLSPWTDLSVSGASVDYNRGNDLWFTRAHLTRWASYYLGSHDPRSPSISPLFAELSGLPPLLVLVGEHELLRDDAARVVARAREAGSAAQLLVGSGMQHDWPLTLPWLAESRAAWQAMGAFVAERCAAAGATPDRSSEAPGAGV
jgi:epsilon-lactone hydrolase